MPSVGDVDSIARALELPPHEASALRTLTENIYVGVKDWRASGSRLGALQDDVAKYEEAASTIRLLQTSLIPGLLQTGDYTRSILTAYESFERTEPYDIQAAITKRMSRQEILYEPGKKIFVVLLESVLHYRLCPPAVMLTQIDHLRLLNRIDNVSIRIVPHMSALPVVAPHPIEIFDDVALTIDLANTALFTDGANDIRFYLELFEAYSRIATDRIEPFLSAAYGRFADALA